MKNRSSCKLNKKKFLLKYLLYILIIITFFLSCKEKVREESALFTLMDNCGINFQNTVKDTKAVNSFLFRNFYNGGGVAIGDINNDGLPDVILTSNLGENKLYLNKGDFKFKDITSTSGMKQDSMWSTGVTMVDINNDGWLDIYVCSSGHIEDGKRRNKLYINNHNNTFTEAANQYGLDISGFCTQATFFDYDNDGDLDCFIINNSPLPFSALNYGNMRDMDVTQWKVDDKLRSGGNHLYQNNNGHFKEVTKDAGLHTGLITFGLGVTVADINGDGYPDIYVGNDLIEKDYLYINQRNGTFKDSLESFIQHISMSSMGSDIADINNDGHPDIFTTDMLPEKDFRLKTTGTYDNFELYNSKQKQGLYHQFVKNCLQLNNRNNAFTEIANFAGVSATDWSWGTVMFDADNDGYNDIFVCNGINHDVGDLDFLDFLSNDVYSKSVQGGEHNDILNLLNSIPVTPLPNKFYKNSGNLSFHDIGNEWGFSKPTFSNTVAYGDLNNDGALDMIINNENQPAFVYRNNSMILNKNHFIGIKIKGCAKNTFGIGTIIKIFKDDKVFYREIQPVRGFQSSMDYKQIIGLGGIKLIDSMLITWPDHSYSRFIHPALDTVHVISELEEKTIKKDSSLKGAFPTLLQGVASSFDMHHEDDHIDFYYERNVPELLSHEGPHIARGDVNGDGLEDVYIGGAKGQGGQLYVQTAKGFVKKSEPSFKSFHQFEDVAVLFFDADGDGDLDLFVGSGGNNVVAGNRETQHRLFINDGKGNFKLDESSFPANNMNISVAVANDFNGDGYLDLFVGSRSVPFSYGVTPTSYLYLNDGHGHFKDVATEMNKGIRDAGMVTSAVWADVSGDKRKELVIVGAFMAPRIFSYNGKTFDELSHTGLEGMSGWWQSIAEGDLNGDGFEDLVLGNIGENFYLHPDKDHPVNLWINDFDGNGTKDEFLTRSIEGRDMPVFLKREITDQFPFLKKNNLKHSEYAKKSFQDLFSKEQVSASQKKTFNYCSSVVCLNTGKGGFAINKLPVMVQLSSVNAICLTDVNNDGKMDLVLGGNMFGFPPQFGRLDGSYGHVLINEGKGTYNWMEPARSGLSLRGEIRDIKEIRNKGKRSLLVVQNNEKPVILQIK